MVFSHYSDSGLKTKLSHIMSMMTGNSNFPSPVPGLPQLQTKLSEYDAALTAAQTRAVGTAAAKNEVREEIELMFKELAGYIMSQTSVKSVIDTSGFDSTGESGPIGELPAPQIIVESGQGSVTVRITPVHGAANYIVEMCDVDPQSAGAQFYVVGNPTAGHLEVAIPALTYRWVRCRANGTAGESPNSAIIRCSAY